MALLAAATVLAPPACARRAATPAPVAIRFAIEVENAADSVFVLVNGADDQPGWLTVTGPAGRVYLRERCDIADCGAEPAVCGMAIPEVRRIGAGAAGRRIELVWDGTTSEVDTASRCERRRPTEPGDYRARFCFARRAEPAPAGAGPAQTLRLVSPICVERRFTLDDRSVVLTL